jgi:hypothetical protein
METDGPSYIHEKAACFLPMSIDEGKDLGIEQFDDRNQGDAYVDHPLGRRLSRVLWNAGYSWDNRPPDWKSDEDFRSTASSSSASPRETLTHGGSFTPNQRRSNDVYSPGGALRRPDRAVVVYANSLRSSSRRARL